MTKPQADQGRLPVTPARKQLLATVHIGRKELGMDDYSYRALLSRITGRESSSMCTDAQLTSVIREMKRAGFKPKPGHDAKPVSGKGKVRLIYALWNELVLHLDDADDKSLRGFVRRQTRTEAAPDGVSDPEFLTDKQADRVIEGLKQWSARKCAARGAAR